LLHELQSISLPEDLITVTHNFQPWLISSLSPSDTLGGFPPCSQVWRLLNTSAPYAIVTFPILPTSLPERPSTLDFFTTMALVHSFLAMFILRHTTFARRGTFLRATANSFRDL
jgi:hypothetical protein